MILTTPRLRIAPFTDGDSDSQFVLALVNDPDWLRYIGDKRVRTLDDARRYLREGPLATYAQHGFGLCRVDRLSDGQPIGMCGLLWRDTLDAPDLGFAFMPTGRGSGFAREAAAAVLAHGFSELQLPRIVAIVDPANAASVRVLEGAGMCFERDLQLASDDVPLRLFALHRR